VISAALSCYSGGQIETFFIYNNLFVATAGCGALKAISGSQGIKGDLSSFSPTVIISR
jgi:hypothetical protein